MCARVERVVCVMVSCVGVCARVWCPVCACVVCVDVSSACICGVHVFVCAYMLSVSVCVCVCVLICVVKLLHSLSYLGEGNNGSAAHQEDYSLLLFAAVPLMSMQCDNIPVFVCCSRCYVWSGLWSIPGIHLP